MSTFNLAPFFPFSLKENMQQKQGLLNCQFPIIWTSSIFHCLVEFLRPISLHLLENRFFSLCFFAFCLNFLIDQNPWLLRFLYFSEYGCSFSFPLSVFVFAFSYCICLCFPLFVSSVQLHHHIFPQVF